MSDNQQQESSRKPRNYYIDYSKRKFYNNNNNRGKANPGGNKSKYSATPDISFGNKGFLITSIDEVKSYLEMRNLLEEYFEQLYKDEDKDNNKQEINNDGKQNETYATVEDELERELKQLRIRRPFKQVKTRCKNNIFINIVKEFHNVDPMLVVDKFFDDLSDKRQIRTTNTFKVLPILDTFRISLSCAKEAVTNILQNIILDKEDKRTYFIEFQSRGNYKLNSEDKQNWIEGVASKITELRPNWSVDRENADYIVLLIALKDVCCITFLKHYFKRSKYNVVEFYKQHSQVLDQEPDKKLETSGDHGNDEK